MADKISGLPPAVSVELTDEFAVNQSGVTRRANTSQVATAIEPGIDHTTIQNIGTNSHAQIDTHIADVTNPHSVSKAQVGLGNVENTKVNLVATTPPTVNDDNTAGYSIASAWVDTVTDKIYGCLDASTGAAVWGWLNSVAQGHLTVTAGANSSQARSPYATDIVAATASSLFSFDVPDDFVSIDSAHVHVISGGTASGLDIDIIINWAAEGEAYNANSSSDTTSTYSMVTDNVFKFNIGSLLSSIVADDIVGVEFDQNSIGFSNYYVVLHVTYNRA